MPTEPHNSETGLPPELSEVEALLKRLSPADSTVNRDTLMYQAGYAAAATRSTAKRNWLWPTTSAALAATLLLVLTLPTFLPARPLQRAGIHQSTSGSPISPLTTTPPTPVTQPEPIPTFTTPLKRYTLTAPLLALRDQALRQDFDDLPYEDLADEVPSRTDTTNRQLLREFLPDSRLLHPPSRRQSLFWTNWNFGETS